MLEASSGDEAVTVLETDMRIDVLFSDVHMPGRLGGFGLAQWVRQNRSGTKVLLTSGITRKVAVATEICDGGPLMPKPYDFHEVGRRLRALLRSKHAMGPHD